jgi:hypothetical protein
MPNDRLSLSALEKPAPSEMLPVAFSLTVAVRSTWSFAPATSVVSMLDLASVVPRRLELAELASHDLVARAGVAGDVDLAHVDATGRVADQHHDDAAGLAVDLGPCLDAGEGVAELAEQLLETARRVGHRLGAVGLAGLDRDQALELVFLAEEIAFEADRGHRVGLTLGDVDRDRDVLLVGRDRDLRRIDVELEVAAVQVVGAQRLEVGVELGARVAIGLGVPGQPAAGGAFELAAQRALGKDLVAGDADLVDLGDVALDHAEGHCDPVAIDRRDGGDHLRAVVALAQILPLEFLLGAVGQRAVEGLPLADADVLEGLGQGLLVELLQAGELDARDDRAFLDDHHRDVIDDLDAHVLEQAGGKQRAQRGGALLVGVRVADPERQRAEHGAGIGALEALDADVLEREGIDRPCRRTEQAGQGNGQQAGAKRGGATGGATRRECARFGEQHAAGRLSAARTGGPDRCRERATSSGPRSPGPRVAAVRATARRPAALSLLRKDNT